MAAVQDPVAQLYALIDIMVIMADAIHSMGLGVPEAWKEVMRSNFAKVDPRTGRVSREEDGKMLKPQNWEPLGLERFIRTP